MSAETNRAVSPAEMVGRVRPDYGGGSVRLAYQYAYGFDGGRRWRKDYLNGVWTRYPCGVACGAGDLVAPQKPLEGGHG